MKNLTLLLISKNRSRLADLEEALVTHGQHRVLCCSRPEEAYEAVATDKVDGVIVDEEVEGSTGLEFIREFTPCHPFIHCALVSSLYAAEFHEAIEGYGVFMQIPPGPGRKEAEQIGAHLAKIG